MNYLFIFVPLLAYVLAFLYETYRSYVMLLKNSKKSIFTNFTWEVTHTLLIYSVVSLTMLYSKHLRRLADLILIPMSFALGLISVRAVVFLYLFFVNTKPRKPKPVLTFFFLIHLLTVVSLLVALYQILVFLGSDNISPLQGLYGWLVPGFIATLTLCFMPIMQLYGNKTK